MCFTIYVIIHDMTKNGIDEIDTSTGRLEVILDAIILIIVGLKLIIACGCGNRVSFG